MIYAAITAILAALITASAYLSGMAALDVSRVAEGELWRIFTGHLTHLTWRQYVVDAPIFALLYGTYVKKVAISAAIYLYLFAAVSVSLAVIFTGKHQVYGGLSGISCAAFSSILFTLMLEHPRQPSTHFLGSAFCIYLLFMGGITSGVKVAQEAHLAGTLSGVIFAALRMGRQKFILPGKKPGLTTKNVSRRDSLCIK